MQYASYTSEEEYDRAIEEERAENPDCFFDIVLGAKYMEVETGLAQSRRDFELRYGVPNWKRYGVELLTLPHFPAGKALTTTKEIVTYRNKISKKSRDSFTIRGFDIEMIENETFRQMVKSNYQGAIRLRNFRDAYNYSLGKSVILPYSTISIKADSNGLPQLSAWY